jgi:hypothetical protein
MLWPKKPRDLQAEGRPVVPLDVNRGSRRPFVCDGRRSLEAWRRQAHGLRGCCPCSRPTGIEAGVPTTIAQAGRDEERLRFSYTTRAGAGDATALIVAWTDGAVLPRCFGALSTYATFSHEVPDLIEGGFTRTAVRYFVGSIAAGIAAVYAGFAITDAFVA